MENDTTHVYLSIHGVRCIVVSKRQEDDLSYLNDLLMEQCNAVKRLLYLGSGHGGEHAKRTEHLGTVGRYLSDMMSLSSAVDFHQA